MELICWLLMLSAWLSSTLTKKETSLGRAVNLPSLTVMWTPPLETNGIIRNYMVRWLEEGKVSQNVIVEHDVTNYTIHDLAPCTSYTVTVKAATSNGFGDESDPKNATTVTAGPPAPSVTCKASTSPQQLTVTWPEVDTNCLLHGYMVNCTGEVLWSATVTEDTAETAISYIDLDGLIPWTNYTVCVAGVVADNTVGEWNCCTSTTHQAVPGEPTNLHQTSASRDSLTVSWDQPKELNGELTAYQLTWIDQVSSLITPNITSYTVFGLHPNSKYNVTLKAGTVAGWGASAQVQVVTTGENVTVGAIVGSVVGGVFGGLLVVAALVALVFYRRKRKEKIKTPEVLRPTPGLPTIATTTTAISIRDVKRNHQHDDDQSPGCDTQQRLQEKLSQQMTQVRNTQPHLKEETPHKRADGTQKNLMEELHNRRAQDNVRYLREELSHRTQTLQPSTNTTNRKVNTKSPRYIHEEQYMAFYMDCIYETESNEADDATYVSLD
ncbi:cell adhesion molecule DSCAM isoform X1 [Cherax quadricarinatus]